jgi:hypothetical protein
MNSSNQPKGSRTYTLKMSKEHEVGNPIIMERGATYRHAKGFLNLLERAWKARGLSPVREKHNRLSMSGFIVWFDEEKKE